MNTFASYIKYTIFSETLCAQCIRRFVFITTNPMKKLLTLITAFMLVANSFAQAPNWEWAASAGGHAIDAGYSTAVDLNGNLYVTGYFQSPTITFGGITLTLDSIGTINTFIVKYNANGNVIWACSIGGDSRGTSITTDRTGNCYITGYFMGNTIHLGSITLLNSGGNDLFILKLDVNGSVLWAKSAGSSAIDQGFGIAADENGNSYVTGNFADSINFGSQTLTSSGVEDIFIVKYDSVGTEVWAKSAGGINNDYSTSVVIDESGNSYITGYFSSTSLIIGSTTLTNTGSWDIFRIKYDNQGNVVWAKSEGGTNDDEGKSISVDVNGNTYVTGRFVSSSISFGNTTLNSSGYFNTFIAKYDTNGNPLWAKAAGSSEGVGISSNITGNIYVTGYFYSSIINFSGITLTNDTTNFTADIFVVKYDTTGTILWAKSAGGSKSDHVASISLDVSGNCYFTGFFTSQPITFASNSFIADSSDVFIAKLKDNCFAYYQTTYDSITNNFTLIVDPTTATLATSYHWDFGDGTTSNLASPTHTYATNSLYNVCMTIYTASGDSCTYCHVLGIDTAGNVVRSGGFTLNVNNNTTVGLNQVTNNSNITISPNPFTSQTTISISSTNNQQLTTLIVSDVLGNVIKNIRFSGKQYVLEKGDLSAGIYFVQLTDENKNCINKKIIIQ